MVAGAPTGGMSTLSGQSVLVTPSGQQVGSAAISTIPSSARRNKNQANQQFESDLLQQSFSSASARDAAEQAYRTRQATRNLLEQRRQEAIASRRLGGQLTNTSSRILIKRRSLGTMQDPQSIATPPNSSSPYLLSGSLGGITTLSGRSYEVTPSGRKVKDITPNYKPELVVSAAPTVGERYRSFITNRNPFTATYEFGLGLARQGLGSLESRYAPKGQSIFSGETGRRVQIGAQIAPYFIPATSGIFAVGTGVGQFTPGGIREAVSTGQVIQSRTGIPTGVGAGTILASSALLGLGGINQIAKQAGIGSSRTILLGKQTRTLQTEQGTFSETKGFFLTERGFLLKERNFGVISTETKIVPGQANTFSVASNSFGNIVKERGVGFVSGAVKYGRSQRFGTFTEGLGKQVSEGLSLTLSKGRIQIAGREARDFVSIGKSGQLENLAVNIGRIAEPRITAFGNRVFPKGSRSQFGSIIINPKGNVPSITSGQVLDRGTTFIRPNTNIVRTPFSKTFGSQSLNVKAVSENLAVQAAASQTLGFGYQRLRGLGLLGASNLLRSRQDQSSNQAILFISPLAEQTKNSHDVGQAATTSLGSGSKQRYGSGVINIQGSGTSQSFFSGTIPALSFTTPNVGRNLGRSSFDSPITTPRVGLPFVPPFGAFLSLSSSQGRSRITGLNFSPRYNPSFTASAFNLTGVVPKRFRGGITDPFSRRVIPIKKRSSKKRKRK